KWNIVGFLSECKLTTIRSKIGLYLKCLETIINTEKGKRHKKAENLIKKYREGDKADYKLAKDWELEKMPINIQNTFSSCNQTIGIVNDVNGTSKKREQKENNYEDQYKKRKIQTKSGIINILNDQRYFEEIIDDVSDLDIDAFESSSKVGSLSGLRKPNDELVVQENFEYNEEKRDIQDDETPSVAPSTIKTERIVESNKKTLQDLLGIKYSENMQLICQYHDKTYPDEILLDLRPNSIFSKELPLDILSPYLKKLDDKIENLILSHIHEFLTQFFKQNLTGEDWHTKIDDLQCQNCNDLLMVSVIRILRRTLPPFIIAFSLGPRNPLLNLTTLEKPHLNNFVHPCLQTCLWYISSINYEFEEIRTENYKNQCADGVGYLNTADKY
ncbi:8201_t:CDS:2, partial [Scutellospora calospora]